MELGKIAPGTYYISVETELHTNDYWQTHGQHIHVTNYGPGTTTFSEDESTIYPVAQVLEAAFTSKIMKKKKGFKRSNMGLKGVPEISIVEQDEPVDGYKFVYISNKSNS